MKGRGGGEREIDMGWGEGERLGLQYCEDGVLSLCWPSLSLGRDLSLDFL